MKTAIKTRLTRDDFAELVEIEERLASLSVEARAAADSSGLNRREIAMRMGNASPSTLQRLLKGMAYNATLDTIARFAWACGYDLKVQFVPRNVAQQPAREARRSDADKVVWLEQYRTAPRGASGTWTGPGRTAANNSFGPDEFLPVRNQGARTANGC